MIDDVVFKNEPRIIPKALMKIEIDAIANETGRVNYFTGHLIRGALLHMISRNDPELVALMHDGQSSRPYSVAPLKFPYRPDQRNLLWEMRPGDKVTFRLSSLSHKVNKRIMEGILYDWSNVLKIGEVHLSIVRVRFDSTSFEELVKATKGAKVHEFRFLSPTKFEIRSETFPMLFPLPTYVYGGLGSLWNKFAPEELHLDMDYLMDNLRSNICVTQYSTRTAAARIKGHIPITGFVGRVRYKVSREAPRDFINMANLLTLFANYSGVGAKRSFGFGAVNAIALVNNDSD